MKYIDVRVSTTAEPRAIYELLCDGATWPTWSPLGSFELTRPGADAREGVGAIRVFRTGRVTTTERVAELVPDRRFSYELVSGLAIRDYRADVDLHTSDGHIDLDIPVTTDGKLRENEVRGKINGGGSLMTIRTGDGSIHLRKS